MNIFVFCQQFIAVNSGKTQVMGYQYVALLSILPVCWFFASVFSKVLSNERSFLSSGRWPQLPTVYCNFATLCGKQFLFLNCAQIVTKLSPVTHTIIQFRYDCIISLGFYIDSSRKDLLLMRLWMIRGFAFEVSTWVDVKKNGRFILCVMYLGTNYL